MLLGPGSARRRSRRRIVRDVLVAALGLSSLGFAVSLRVGVGGKAVDVATVAGLFIGLASLLLAVVDFFREDGEPPDLTALADDLALRLREQWLEEAEARQLQDPRVLPLAWATTTRDVADTLRTGTANARVLRMRLDGRLNGRFDDVIGQLAAGYARIPNRRLVVTGEPGSGKTVLAILLTLGLLGVRETGGPVPVLLPVSSWDPVRERLDDWIVRTVAQPYYNGRAEIPRTLLAQGLLLPVLDGLDEIPESARRSAIRGINHAVGGERPIVVTCRAVEYEELIHGGAPTLRQAAVVEVRPVPPQDAIAYLREVDWPAGVDWNPVFTRLRTEPDGPLQAALSTPLMVTSARLVYERGGGNPVELLDAERFDSAHAVEDHLIQRLVAAAYAPEPGLPPGTAARERWSAEQARRWLAFLAGYLHDRRERDIAWWLMSGRLLSPWVGPLTGLAIGALLVLAAVGWAVATRSIAPDDRGLAVIAAIGVGGAFALFNSLVWYASEAKPPGRLAWSVRGSAGRLARGFRGGALIALVSAGPLVLAVTAARVIKEPGSRGTPGAVAMYVEGITITGALAVVSGLALAAHNWLDAPPSRATQVSPLKSLAQDRLSALVSAGAAGFVVALTGLVGWYAGVMSGDLLLRLLTRWSGWPGRPDVSTLGTDRWRWLTGTFGDWPSTAGIAVLLPGVVFTLLVLMGRAWPRFVVARLYLAARGQLPWRLMTFLADARRRELLRQASGVYQFRHIRLQETLAGELANVEEERREPTRRAAVRRRAVLAAGAGIAVVATSRAISSRRDDSVARFAVPGRRRVVAVAMRPGTAHEVVFALDDGPLWRWSGDTAARAEPLREVKSEDSDALRVQTALAFSADSGLLMAAREAGRVEVWALPDGRKQVPPYPYPAKSSYGYRVLLAVHDKYIAWSDLSYIGVWKASPGGAYTMVRPKERSVGNPSFVAGMAFLRDGSLALMDDTGETRRYPSAESEQPKLDLPSTNVWNSGRLYNGSESSALLASPYDDSLAFFGRARGELRPHRGNGWDRHAYSLGESVRTGAFHPKRALLAVADMYGGDVQLWQTDLRRPVRVGRLTGHHDSVLALDFSPDSDWLATASADGTVRIWDVSRF